MPELHPHWVGNHSQCNPKWCPDLPTPEPEVTEGEEPEPEPPFDVVTWKVRLRSWWPVHEATSALRFVGLRARLRCPECRAVGTWKPHGYWAAKRAGDRPVRRWLCKCCGRYEGPEGVHRGYPCPEHGCWRLAGPVDPDCPPDPPPTPRARLKAAKVWPWVG